MMDDVQKRSFKLPKGTKLFKVCRPYQLPTPTYLGSIAFDPATNGDVTVLIWFDSDGKMQHEVVDT
jgi:hypothetical protein